MKHILTVAVTLTALTACQNTAPGGYGSSTTGGTTGINKQQIGTIAGALGGAFAGKNLGKGNGRTLGIAAGTLLGGFIGNQVGASLDKADMLYHEQTAQRTFETGKNGVANTWTNPDTGHTGTIIPTKTYQVGADNYCREFTQTINVGGQEQRAFGTACRQPDGSWKIQS